MLTWSLGCGVAAACAPPSSLSRMALIFEPSSSTRSIWKEMPAASGFSGCAPMRCSETTLESGRSCTAPSLKNGVSCSDVISKPRVNCAEARPVAEGLVVVSVDGISGSGVVREFAGADAARDNDSAGRGAVFGSSGTGGGVETSGSGIFLLRSWRLRAKGAAQTVLKASGSGGGTDGGSATRGTAAIGSKGTGKGGGTMAAGRFRFRAPVPASAEE